MASDRLDKKSEENSMPEFSEKPQQTKGLSLGGPKEAFVVLFFLVLLSSVVGPVVKPVFFLALAVALFYYVLKAGFSFGKISGWTVVAALCLMGAGFGYWQHLGRLKHEALLTRLEAFDDVSILRAKIFPTSPIIQISAENKIDDRDLRALADIPELQTVTHFYLRDTLVTEEGLKELDRFSALEYVLIESSRMSNEAIYQFEQKRPHLTVINSDGS